MCRVNWCLCIQVEGPQILCSSSRPLHASIVSAHMFAPKRIWLPLDVPPCPPIQHTQKKKKKVNTCFPSPFLTQTSTWCKLAPSSGRLVYQRLSLEDVPGGNLLEQLPAALRFMDLALRKGGGHRRTEKSETSAFGGPPDESTNLSSRAGVPMFPFSVSNIPFFCPRKGEFERKYREPCQ